MSVICNKDNGEFFDLNLYQYINNNLVNMDDVCLHMLEGSDLTGEYLREDGAVDYIFTGSEQDINDFLEFLKEDIMMARNGNGRAWLLGETNTVQEGEEWSFELNAWNEETLSYSDLVDYI